MESAEIWQKSQKYIDKMDAMMLQSEYQKSECLCFNQTAIALGHEGEEYVTTV